MIRTARSIGQTLGKLIDEEDRQVLGKAVVLAGAAVGVAVTLATAAGLGVLIFRGLTGF